MKFKQIDKRTWLVNGEITNCRTSVKDQLIQDYFKRNQISPEKWTTLPRIEFEVHYATIKALWKRLGL